MAADGGGGVATPEGLQVHLEFGWEGGRDRLPLPGQGPRMEPQSTWEPGHRDESLASVTIISNDGVADAMQVSPDLVFPSLGWFHREQGELAQHLKASPPGHRRVGGAPLDQWMTDDPFGPGLAMDQSHVDLLNGALRQRRGGLSAHVRIGGAQE